MNEELIRKLLEFIENEGKACSMDSGCMTPEYVYRMWGGTVPLEEIKAAFDKVKNDKTLWSSINRF